MRGPFDIRSLAQAINRRREEYNLRHPYHPAAITPAMSRILENDPDYVPYRQRKAVRGHRRAPMNPSIGTVVEIAASLDVTVGSLLGERAYRITNADRERVRQFVRYLVALFELDDLR